MKNKSAFSLVIILILIAVLCIVLTVGAALILGSYNQNIFNFENMNYSNIFPVLIIGGFISCIIIFIAVLFVSRTIFLKVKENIIQTKNDGGNEK